MRLSDKCKSTTQLISHLSASTFAPIFQHLPLTLLSLLILIVFFLIYLILSLTFPRSPCNPLPFPLPSSFLPLCECCCFPLLCGCVWRSPREAEERMYPRGLFGVLLSVDQHAPDGLTGSSMHSEALTGATGLFKTQVQSSTKHSAFQTRQ